MLCYGLFPYSIDKIFSSKKFGKVVINNINDNHLGVKNNVKFSLLSYKLTRNDNAPRYMGIPHPLAYLDLCRSIKQNWNKIDDSIGKDNDKYIETSMIIPKSDNKNKRLISIELYDKNIEEEYLFLDKQLHAKYFVYADISKCFPSIYSHSIPWALVEKETAKDHMNDNTKWYNELDKKLRSMKNNETNGIPIGPDTSNIFVEIVLSQIDRFLLKKKYTYLRFVDDYKCYCKTEKEAQNFIKDLSSQLEKYQLELNTTKTKIERLPKVITDNWVRQLRNFNFPKDNKITFKKIQDFLDLSVELSKEKGDYSPFKYAVKSLKTKKFSSYLDYKKTILYISSIVYIHPYIIDIFDDLIGKAIDAFKRDKNDFLELIKNFLSKLLPEHIGFRRSDIVVWVLFLAIKYKTEIKDFEKLSDDILEMDDPLPSLLAFLYAKSNAIDTKKYFDKLKNVDQKQYWLYIYELHRLNDIQVNKTLSSLEYKGFYDWLKNNNITFLSGVFN